ncbi:MAG: hypothetical protein A2667_00765 [Candidatus Wildermuthbacteria bacterium RIFCSPHIGHO2_01_FULL_47_27]|nr:MAG: hypothetical protein A2667_00765 [Candidatus Wildermuthbacteria bacterium RIFCSPHIGHO2_01_FULL_47_27]
MGCKFLDFLSIFLYYVNMNHEQSIFLTAAKWSLLLLVLTPFIVDKSVFFPFIEGKTIYIRAVVTLALFLLAGFFIFARKEERLSFIARKLCLLKNPTAIFIGLFFVSIAFSAVFAKDSFRAFFGTVERGEGLAGLLFFGGIFFLALLLFERKEWRLFFAAVLIGGLILFTNEILELVKNNWIVRFTGGTMGNPSFLAGYLLFVLFAAFALLEDFLAGRVSWRGVPRPLIILFLGVGALAAAAGIFLTQTRGTYIGLAAGIGAVFLYFGARWLLLKFPAGLRPKIGIAALLLALLLGSYAVFLFWQVASGQDTARASLFPLMFQRAGSFQTRYIAVGVSLNSILPSNEGWGRFLFGWGQDNFNIAYNTYFNPRYFIYENVWFDRAHNKVLDVLVMQGFFGLLAYLGIWVAVLRSGLKSNKLLSAAFLFFIVSYFTHTLFLFDNPSTNIVIFAFFAFAVFRANQDGLTLRPGSGQARSPQGDLLIAENKSDIRAHQLQSAFVRIGTIAAALTALWLFVWATWLPYMQMKNYVKLKASGLPLIEFTAKLDEVFYPYSYIQERIRIDLLKTLPEFPADEGIGKLVSKVMQAADEIMEREPYEPRHPMNAGQILEEVEAYDKAELYYRKALALVPNRPDLLYLLAQNLVIQGKIEEAKAGPLAVLFEQSKAIPKSGILYGAALLYAPEEYQDEAFAILESSLKVPGMMGSLGTAGQLGTALPVMRQIYNDFLALFVQRKDEKNFLAALDTAIKLEEDWEQQKELQLEKGKIEKLPWEDEAGKKSELYKKVREAFPKYGWEVVNVE